MTREEVRAALLNLFAEANRAELLESALKDLLDTQTMNTFEVQRARSALVQSPTVSEGDRIYMLEQRARSAEHDLGIARRRLADTEKALAAEKADMPTRIAAARAEIERMAAEDKTKWDADVATMTATALAEVAKAAAEKAAEIEAPLRAEIAGLRAALDGAMKERDGAIDGHREMTRTIGSLCSILGNFYGVEEFSVVDAVERLVHFVDEVDEILSDDTLTNEQANDRVKGATLRVQAPPKPKVTTTVELIAEPDGAVLQWVDTQTPTMRTAYLVGAIDTRDPTKPAVFSVFSEAAPTMLVRLHSFVVAEASGADYEGALSALFAAHPWAKVFQRPRGTPFDEALPVKP